MLGRGKGKVVHVVQVVQVVHAKTQKHRNTEILVSVFFGIILLVFLLPHSGYTSDIQSYHADSDSLFLEAGRAYQEQDFARACELYQEVLDQGIISGHLLYNLGNCHFRLGRVGRALLFYRRARIFIPRDADLKANIRYAIQNRRDQIESGQSGFKKVFFFWYYGTSPREIVIIFLFVNFLLWGGLGMFLFRRRDWIRWVLMVSAVLWLIFGSAATAKLIGTTGPRNGVVLEPEIEVRSGYSRNDTVLFKLHEGAEFRVEGQEKGWYKIRLADGKRGWINGEFVGIVEKTPYQ